MRSHYKKYFKKIYIVPIVFIATSFIFTTFAWFAYSGLRSVSTEIDVKTWHIELTKSNETINNNIVISLDNVYPGMETVDEIINIQNQGDSDAKLSYKIISSRILNSEIDGQALENNEMLSDSLSHEYPFHLNIDLSKRYISAGGDSSTFEVSVSWPLDSGNDDVDSLWGTNAYNFQNEERTKKNNNPEYVQRPAVQLVISIMAEQYTGSVDDSDKDYNLGDTILYDVVLNRKCDTISETCLNTTVIDYNNKLGDITVTLLPSLYGNYETGTFNNYSTLLNNYTNNWSVPNRALTVNDILKVISHDVINSHLNGATISPQIIGSLDYNNRITTEINRAKTLNGYYTFRNDRFSYLSSNSCYWVNSEYNNQSAFAFMRLDENNTKVYAKDKTEECRIIPVILAPKDNIN